jgi:hypothetical protein
LGLSFRSGDHFGVQKITAILCRANSTNITKDRRVWATAQPSGPKAFSTYVLPAFHPCSYFRYAIAAAASCALIAIILLALALVLPDFSLLFVANGPDVRACLRGFVVPVTAKGKCLGKSPAMAEIVFRALG